MTDIATLRTRYPTLPAAYFRMLAKLDGWEGFLGANYVVLFDAATAVRATDEYRIPEYRPGYFALGSDGGGEILVCALAGAEDRPLCHLAAIGMSDAPLLEVAPSMEQFAETLLAAVGGNHA
jgi:hypothetical protein